MKMLLLVMGLLVSGTIPANAIHDTIATPDVIQLAKVSKHNSKSKFWILYHTPSDLISLEKEGYTVLKTKVKLVRNNQFWLEMWQSSIQMAAGFIIARGGENNTPVILPAAIQKSGNNLKLFNPN